MTPAILSNPLIQEIMRVFPGAQIRTRREGVMLDPTPHEIEALEAASFQAGEYLESTGKTDVAQMTPQEWMTLVEVVVTGFQDELLRLKNSGKSADTPF